MRRLLPWLLILQLAFTPAFGPAPRPAAQTLTVNQLMARMTPAEKVGQLFMVTFYGPTAETGSEIERLISQQRVGGVAILAANDNITDTVNAPAQVLELANRLQAIAIQAADAKAAGPAEEAAPFIPLFIATNHEGDGYPNTEIRSGLTSLPSAMAIGATWDPAQAQAMGAIAGAELASLGINFLLGPSLDVLEAPRPLAPGGLGTRVFGGDPYWVGSLGRSYIRGVHQGAAGHLAVAAKFFPGYGASDRDPAEEVPTVRKSLDELTRIDLLPFFMVTGQAAEPAGTADALMSAHIRFQGFQGNIRETTSPVSFDPRAFAQLLALPEISTWRAAGGLTVSDALGARSVKRFYDPAEREFNPRRIASEAFIAGNDLLYLADFGLNPRQDQTRNIVDVITYFGQRYTEDRTFAAQVDAAVARILQLKLRLYGGRLTPEAAQRPADGLAGLGQGRAQVLTLARDAASLISPSLEELAARAPEAPGPTERLVFFTDSRVGRQCTDCPLTLLLDRKALENAVLQFYGPGGSGQVNPRNLQSFSFDELAAYLNTRANPPPTPGPETPAPEASPVEAALSQADWIVLAMLDVNAGSPNANLVSTFLSQRSDILRTKKTVVFAFGAPYFLDTTDLSKVTAYYALYSKAPAFVETAARLLFRELVPHGSPPVSVEGVNYDLIRVTAPDPLQTIQLFSFAPAAEAGTPAPTGTLTPTLGLKVGDALELQTSVILDLNGHPVPDGTPARFMLVYTAGDGSRDFEFLNTETVDGVARASLTLNRIGFLEISINEPVVERSTKLQIQLQQGTTAFFTPIPPPTNTPTITPTPTSTPTPTLTPTITPTATPSGELRPGRIQVGGGDFLMLLLGLLAVLTAGYRLGGADAQPRRSVRVALLGAIGALAGYNFYALSLPGAEVLARSLPVVAPLVSVVVGGGLGLGAGWYWLKRGGGAR